MIRFALLGTGTMLLVSAGAVLVSDYLAEQEALRDSRARAEGIARGIAAPHMSQATRRGDMHAIARLDRVMEGRISEGGVTHVILWDDDGRVIWSDTQEFIGQVYALSSSAQLALDQLTTVAHLPEDREEHQSASYPGSEFVEVYTGTVGQDGERFVFEAYMPPDRIAEDRAAVLPKLLGVSLGSLAIFFIAAVPLALSLARRVDEEQQLRVRALDRSVSSWRHQRRLLAQELHDGVIQDLAALGYGLSVLDARAETDETSAVIVDRLRASAEHAERSLRSMVLDLTPRQLAEDGLSSAAADLAERYRSYGLDVTLTVEDDLDFPEGTGILAFRALREGLRNVAKHTDAKSVWISLRSRGADEGIEVEIADDGSSPASAAALRSGQGLRLLADTVGDAGGTLTLGPARGGGTRLLAVVPPLQAEPGRP